MKRKLLKALALLFALVLISTGCQQAATKNVVAPYSLTGSQKELLQYLNMSDTAMLFSYRSPDETLSVTASSYVLEQGAWVKNGEGTIFWDGQDKEHTPEGVFTLIFQEDRSFEMSLSAQGTSSFRSDPIEFSGDLTSFSHARLSEEQEIQLDQEIPVALFVADSGNSMPSFSTDTYFSPEAFQDMDVVQAVTLTFSKTP